MEDASGTGFWLAGRFTPRQVDWIVVAAALALSGIPLARSDLVAHRTVAVGVAMLPFETVPLLWRRRKPGWVLAVVAAAFAATTMSGAADPHGGEAGLVFAIFAAALYGDPRVRVIAGGMAVGALVIGFGTVLATGEAKGLGHLAGVAFGSGVAWVGGDRTRTRRAYLAQLRERAAQLERDSEEHVRRATDEERSRIARELHDVIAHNVSSSSVLPGAHWESCVRCWGCSGRAPRPHPRSSRNPRWRSSTSSSPTRARPGSRWSSASRARRGRWRRSRTCAPTGWSRSA